MQDKVAASGQTGLSPTSDTPHTEAAHAPDSVSSVSHLAQPAKSMAISEAVAAAEAADTDGLAADAASDGAAVMPITPEVSIGDRQHSKLQLGSAMLSMSSDSLSALPTPTHPSAGPAAAAQELNNALGRSLLQGPLAGEHAAADSPRSERLTSAYSGQGPLVHVSQARLTD